MMESKLLVGGKSIVDKTTEQERALEERRRELAEQRVRWRWYPPVSCYNIFLFKMPLTPNEIFRICNIWIVLRRNLIYLHGKKTSSSWSFSLSKLSDLMLFAEFRSKKQENTNLQFLCDFISGNFDSEKVHEDESFYYKDIIHFFLKWPKYS